MPARGFVLGTQVFVEAERQRLVASQAKQLGERRQFLTGKSPSAGRDNGGNIEAADEWPDAAIVVPPWLIVSLVMRWPLGF